MLYALIGVPLMLLCLSNLGTLLAGTFQFAYSHACCFACGKNHSSHHHHHHNHQKQADHQQQQTHQHYHFEKQRQQHHNQRYQQEYKRRVSRAPPYTPTAQITTNYDKTVVITELPKKVASPVVPKNIPPVVATVKITTSGRGPRIQSRPRPPRPLTPEVRKLLTECAEYSLAQEGGGSTDPAAAKLLQELHNQDPEAGNNALRIFEREIIRRIYGPVLENNTWRIRSNSEINQILGGEDLMSFSTFITSKCGLTKIPMQFKKQGIRIDFQSTVTAHDTPSRVPLIWRPPGDHHHHHHHHHQVQKRPPTPPPRRPPRTPSDQDNSSIAPDTPDVTGHAPHSESSSSESTVRVPVSIVLLVLTGYICLGATVFAAWEEWTFLDGAYFCFITLSTIGFGDLVPGKSFQRADTQNGQLQLVACCAYLLLGLVLIAMSFTLVQEEVIAKCRQVALFIGILKRSPPR
ncbi:hypothetical protein C0J52_23652 [Blattella germanica]|nr:hypothetical protein C0J52_23652 [Blattella germanica]